MALEPGTRFGPYEIVDPIGFGGMGEVYRATDTTLDREVAIKVLPESFASDTERVARFEREAKTLASLSHNNIAQIFGLEKSDGATAIVMELIEGPTLADRVKDGPIGPDEALGIAMQIADALEAAHGAQVVHRDLKPANVKLKDDGTVKVLDFGIAKAVDIKSLSGDAAQMTTPAVTQTGVILGTAAYMSPEQARGKLVDQRTDVWAFGCLLFEMLTGQPAFGGEDVMLTLARVLDRDTDLSSMPGTISPAVRHTIKLCLEKDPNKRISDIRDVRLALEGTFESELPRVAEASAARPSIKQALPIAFATLVVGAVIAGYVGWSLKPEPPPPEPRPVNRFVEPFAVEGGLYNATGILAVSPTGRHFTYNTQEGVYLRSLDELGARLIPGTPNAEPRFRHSFFSPDGESIAANRRGELVRIAISGGVPVVIANVASQGGLAGATWLPDDTIIYGSDGGLFRVPANGGEPGLIVEAEENETLANPILLPDGDSLLFTAADAGNVGETGRIVAQALSTGERTTLIDRGTAPMYLPTGHLIYVLDNNLFGVAFDAGTLTVSGGQVPLVQGININNNQLTADYGVTNDGTLIYVPTFDGGDFGQFSHVWVDRNDIATPVGIENCECDQPSISPDGTRIATIRRDAGPDGASDIWIWSDEQGTFTRLTFEAGEKNTPIWSPDGERVAYAGVGGIYARRADNTGTAELVLEGTNLEPWSWSADGKILYTVIGDQRRDIGQVSVDGDSQPELLLDAEHNEARPALSPDGRWLAYESDESGQRSVYVRPYPDVESGQWQVSAGGNAALPRWSADGTEVFYILRRGGAPILMTTAVATDSVFVVEETTELVRGGVGQAFGFRGYDVTPDAESFIMLRSAGTLELNSQPDIVIVENWIEELKRAIPIEPAAE